MVPKGWDAGHELHALRERMSRLFEEELSAQTQGQGRPDRGGAFAPATDVYLTDDRVVVTVELPGVDPEAVAIKCEGSVLTISGERIASSDGHCHQMERRCGPFLRSLALPPGALTAQRSVKFEDGLLTVELPRS